MRLSGANKALSTTTKKVKAILAVYLGVSSDTLIHADIFFFVATIAVAVFTVGFVILVYYIVRFVNNAKETGEEVRESSIYRLLFNKKKKNGKDR